MLNVAILVILVDYSVSPKSLLSWEYLEHLVLVCISEFDTCDQTLGRYLISASWSFPLLES